MTALGERLKAVRERLGLNQSKLASQLNFSSPTVVSRFERGERLPSTETLIKLAELYEIDLHWLLTGKPSPTLKDAISQLQPFMSGLLADISQQIKTAQVQLVELEIGQNVMGKENAEKIEQVRTQLKSLETRYKTVLGAIQQTGFMDLDI